ncbi:hypothetical protein EC988_004390 [Linderina pennispora]|nr:hypothetical protein EC988_004390 [Linderina pennispora]
MDTMFRGTLRFQGYSELLDCFLRLGLLDLSSSSKVDVESRFAFLQQVLGCSGAGSMEAIVDAISRKLGVSAADPLIGRLLLSLEELGMLPGQQSEPLNAPTALDALSTILQKSLVYGPGERDLVCLHHEFGIEHSSGQYEVRNSSLVVYGNAESGVTAMARTVGVPAAIATRLLLEGKVTQRGTIRPTIPEIYNPLLERLEKTGVVFNEHSRQGIHNSLQRRMAW